MSVSHLHEGTYAADRREIEYWTKCENCPERKTCKHKCDHPGVIRFLIDGQRILRFEGIITLRKIASVVRDYLECEEEALPLDVAVPPRQMTLEEAIL